MPWPLPATVGLCPSLSIRIYAWRQREAPMEEAGGGTPLGLAGLAQQMFCGKATLPGDGHGVT